MSQQMTYAQVYRSHDACVGGVCAGIAERYDFDPIVMRILAILLIAVTRYISVGSMSMLTVYAILVSCFYSEGNIWIIAWAFLLALLCIFRHRTNLQRLFRGQENKIGQKVRSN